MIARSVRVENLVKGGQNVSILECVLLCLTSLRGNLREVIGLLTGQASVYCLKLPLVNFPEAARPG